MAKLKTTTDSNRKINGNTFLLIITIALFAVMYIAGMVIFSDKGFAKPQMFLNLIHFQCRSAGYCSWSDHRYDHRRY